MRQGKVVVQKSKSAEATLICHDVLVLSRTKNELLSRLRDAIISPRDSSIVEYISTKLSAKCEAEMETQSDNSRAILKSLPDRPESVPSGYEFLPDAFRQDVGTCDEKAVEIIREAFAEGEVTPILKTHLGHREPIPARAWDKWPRDQKVYPRFSDGKMRIGLYPYAGPYLVGWICVQAGALGKILRSGASTRKTTARSCLFSQAELETWYRDRVREYVAKGEIPSREQDWSDACDRFGKDIPRSRVRALRNELSPPDWQKRGRRPKKTGRI